MEQLVNYLSQPSTYKGFAMLASVVGLGIPSNVFEVIGQSVIGIIGAWAVVRDELKGAKKMVEKTK